MKPYTLIQSSPIIFFWLYLSVLFAILLYPWAWMPPYTDNGVSEGIGGRGLQFLSPGIVRSETPPESLYRSLMQSGEMTVELVVSAATDENSGPARIITSSADLLLPNFTLGQEHTALVVRLRTSTTGNRRPAEFQVANAIRPGHAQYIAFSYHSGELRVWVDDGIRLAETALHGDFSDWNPDFDLLLGNEAIGMRSWLGTIQHVAIYDQALPETWIRNRAADLQSSMKPNKTIIAWSLRSTRIPGLVTLFPLALDGPQALRDHSGLQPVSVLRLPATVPLRDTKLLSLEMPTTFAEWANLLVDFVLNVLVFVPLGYFVCRFVENGFPDTGSRIAIAGAIGFILTLGVEIAQYFLESRYSQITDIVANLAGTLIGAQFQAGYRFRGPDSG